MERAVWAAAQRISEAELAMEFAKPSAGENAGPQPGVGQSISPPWGRSSPTHSRWEIPKKHNLCPRTCLIPGSRQGERPLLSPVKCAVGLPAWVEMTSHRCLSPALPATLPRSEGRQQNVGLACQCTDRCSWQREAVAIGRKGRPGGTGDPGSRGAAGGRTGGELRL